ncbi:hypothetical protein J5X84_40375 [Streptosporangiaceae bacterium NEAU-GS5]|nr:hypothetical protein [Streptosporangiaceae bacterium NEAU-GS5]
MRSRIIPRWYHTMGLTVLTEASTSGSIMALSREELRERLDRLFALQDVYEACERRDIGALIRICGKHGITQGQISGLTGIAQGRLSDYARGKHIPTATTTFEAFANGMDMPVNLRRALGLSGNQSGESGGSPGSDSGMDAYDLQLLAETIGRKGQAIKRRELIDLMAKVGAVVSLAQSETWSRISFALDRPSAIDETVVRELEARSDGFHRLEQLIPAPALFKGLAAHLREVGTLLHGTSTDDSNSLRRRLIAKAGESSVLAGWIASDMGDAGTARNFYETAEKAAKEVNDPGIIACALGYKSYMHSTKENHGRARIVLAEAIDVAPRSSPGTVAWLSARYAEESAALGDRKGALASLGQAIDAFSDADPEEDRVWTRFVDRHRFDCFRVAVLAGVGDLDTAQELARAVLRDLPDSNRKRAVIILHDIASANLSQGSIIQAAELGREGLAAMRETERSLWLPRFEALGMSLARWRNQTFVRAYLDDLAQTKRHFALSPR